MVEIHDVIRLLNTAIGAGLRLCINDHLSPLGISFQITVQVRPLSPFVVAAGQFFPALAAVTVPDVRRAVLEIKFGERLNGITLRASFANRV